METQLKQQIEFVNQKYVGRLADLNQRIDDLRQQIVDEERKHEEQRQYIILTNESERNRLLQVQSTRRNSNSPEYEEKKIVRT